jgi:hypothetical protein
LILCYKYTIMPVTTDTFPAAFVEINPAAGRPVDPIRHAAYRSAEGVFYYGHDVLPGTSRSRFMPVGIGLLGGTALLNSKASECVISEQGSAILAVGLGASSRQMREHLGFSDYGVGEAPRIEEKAMHIAGTDTRSSLFASAVRKNLVGIVRVGNPSSFQLSKNMLALLRDDALGDQAAGLVIAKQHQRSLQSQMPGHAHVTRIRYSTAALLTGQLAVTTKGIDIAS